MSLNWLAEASDLPREPITGARICRLTSAPVISHNIYCEVPYSNPEGDRIIFSRRCGMPGTPEEQSQLYIADLERLRIAPVPGVEHGENGPWGEWVYYRTAMGDLAAFSMNSLDSRIVFPSGKWQEQGPIPVSRAITADGRYMAYSRVMRGPTIGIGMIDMHNHTHEMVFADPEITNPHLQFDPVKGELLLVQHNRGSQMTADGQVTRNCGPQGVTLFALTRDGKQKIDLPAGPPVTSSITGHECFIADTGKVVFTAHWNDMLNAGPLDDRFPEGNLFVAAPGDERPHCIKAPEHRFNHVAVSKCGSYWLCDSYGKGMSGAVELVIGCFATDKYRTLIHDCKASCGGAQFTHPHAYITGDNRRIVYNADPHGIPHVHMAEIPDGFLESLQ